MSRSLSNCEKEVMETLYEAGREMNLTEIRDAVNKKHDDAHSWSLQMIATFAARLVVQDLVIASEYGEFKPACTRERYEELIKG